MLDPKEFSEYAEALFIFPWLVAGVFAYMYAKERADKSFKALVDMIAHLDSITQNRSLSSEEHMKLKELSQLAFKKIHNIPRY